MGSLTRIAIPPLLAGALLGCGRAVAGTSSVTDGARVTIHYTLRIDGAVVARSEKEAPLSYVHGAGQIVTGLERALAGLRAGERKRVRVRPEDGFGARDPAARRRVPKLLFSEPEKLEPGVIVRGDAPGGSFSAVVAAVDAESVTLDLNHPLAGKILEFDIEVLAVAAPDES